MKTQQVTRTCNVSMNMAELFCQADLPDSSDFIVSILLKRKILKLFRDADRWKEVIILIFFSIFCYLFKKCCSYNVEILQI